MILISKDVHFKDIDFKLGYTEICALKKLPKFWQVMDSVYKTIFSRSRAEIQVSDIDFIFPMIVLYSNNCNQNLLTLHPPFIRTKDSENLIIFGNYIPLIRIIIL